MNAPKRPYEMVLTIGADSLESMAGALRNITHEVYVMAERGHNNPHNTTSGGVDSGYTYSLTRTDTADHEEYFKQIEAYLAGLEVEKAKEIR